MADFRGGAIAPPLKESFSIFSSKNRTKLEFIRFFFRIHTHWLAVRVKECVYSEEVPTILDMPLIHMFIVVMLDIRTDFGTQ